MGLFKKKPDPISERSRMLQAEIEALETQIKQLNSKVQQNQGSTRYRSTALPDGSTQTAPAVPHAASPAKIREPIFESIDHKTMAVPVETENGPGHYNELGVRKYDLAGAWRRLKNHFGGPPANNPKLVTYLAAGSIKGLRPLRYEKRVARNRFLALVFVLVLVLWGIFAVFVRHL